jgi:hypothetical protein
MTTPFDDVIDEIKTRGFHNHRLEGHSAAMSRGILRDLRAMCEPFERDFAEGRIQEWLDFPSPAGRARKLDLVVAEPATQGGRTSHGCACASKTNLLSLHTAIAPTVTMI